MPAPPPDFASVDDALQNWRQGHLLLESDLVFVHIARLSQPLTEASASAADELSNTEGSDTEASDLTPVYTEAPGFVVLTQTCDIVRSCRTRPYIELAPLIEVSPQEVENIRRLKRPNFAYIPLIAQKNLVADLDRAFRSVGPLQTRRRLPDREP